MNQISHPLFPSPRPFSDGDWALVHPQKVLGKIIEKTCLWGNISFRVWLPSNDSIIRVDAFALSPAQSSALSLDLPRRRGEGRRCANPVRSACAHQVFRYSSAASEPDPFPGHKRRRVRYLLADEVDRGKTIKAGLIMRDLKPRGLVRRTLVVAPKGLATQWVAEMHTHFGEEFRLHIPSDFFTYHRIARKDNLWQSHPQVVCPMDSVRPLDGRRGWFREQVTEYNGGVI